MYRALLLFTVCFRSVYLCLHSRLGLSANASAPNTAVSGTTTGMENPQTSRMVSGQGGGMGALSGMGALGGMGSLGGVGAMGGMGGLGGMGALGALLEGGEGLGLASMLGGMGGMGLASMMNPDAPSNCTRIT
ncbi:hypothetical protein DPMN_038939 [Dreissena polymorpha]|uniref:Uncharacterized protein n=1 Tax=Dreissena polymorpha TaxID=45954 RepID=A0A9D4MI07_DREPO|nr:hypothetical protein DPMN_038939 [Dreissena polymorpha]